MTGETDPPRPATFPPGFDEDDPYEGEDLEDYPGWWRRNVEEFRRHQMRPYRPPQFADGAVTTEVIEALERRHGVSIRLRSVNPHEGGHWEILVGNEPVASVERTRTQGGNSHYHITADAFRTIVEEAVEE